MEKDNQTLRRYYTFTFIATLFFSVLFISCESDMDFDNTNICTDSEIGSDGNIKKTNSIDNQLEALYFPNGMTTKCGNNMLHFSNYEEYEKILFNLKAG